jgi:hypothetical protein
MPRCKICNKGNSMGNGGLKCPCYILTERQNKLIDLVQECIEEFEYFGHIHMMNKITHKLKMIKGVKIP